MIGNSDGTFLERYRGRFGSRLWSLAAFTLVGTAEAVWLHYQPVSDCCTVCRDLGSCALVVGLSSGVVSGGALALSLGALFWLPRTRPWIHATGFVLTALALGAFVLWLNWIGP
jgi:hypothetical protein